MLEYIRRHRMHYKGRDLPPQQCGLSRFVVGMHQNIDLERMCYDLPHKPATVYTLIYQRPRYAT